MNKAIFLLLFFLTACTSTISKENLIYELNQRIMKEHSHINIMWYRGTKDGFHYLSHVYEMFGTKDYKIKTKELYIENTFELTSDSNKFIRISNLSDKWLASRKHEGMWEREAQGINVK